MSAIQVPAGGLQDLGGVLERSSDQIDGVVQSLRGDFEQLVGGPFQGNVQRDMQEVWSQCTADFQVVSSVASSLAARSRALAERMAATDCFGGGMGGFGPSLTMAPLTGAGVAGTLLGAAGGGLNFGGSGGAAGGLDFGSLLDGHGELSIGDSLLSYSEQGQTDIAGVPLSYEGRLDVLGGEAGAVFDVANGDLYAYGEGYGAQASGNFTLGNEYASVSGNGTATVLGAEGWAGVRDGQIGAEIGATLASVEGELSGTVAGMDIGVGAEVGLKAELGFSVGDEVKIDLPFVSLSVDTPSLDELANAPGALIGDLGDAIGGDVGGVISDIGGAVETVTDVISAPMDMAGDAVEEIGDFLGGLF